jgi:hypothetical protein
VKPRLFPTTSTSCIIKVVSVATAGRFVGFRGLDLANLAITTNARSVPGIVLAAHLPATKTAQQACSQNGPSA